MSSTKVRSFFTILLLPFITITVFFTLSSCIVSAAYRRGSSPNENFPFVSISLGHTNSAVAVWDPDRDDVAVVPDFASGARTREQIIAFDPFNNNNNKVLFGTDASNFYNQHLQNENTSHIAKKNTIFGVLRFLGRSFQDCLVEQQKLQQSSFWRPVYFDLIENSTSSFADVEIFVSKEKEESSTLALQRISFQDLLSIFIKKYVKDAEIFVGEKIKSTTVTLPFESSIQQHEDTRHLVDEAVLSATGRRVHASIRRDPYVIAHPYFTSGSFLQGGDNGDENKIEGSRRQQQQAILIDIGATRAQVSVPVEDGDSFFDIPSSVSSSELSGDVLDLILMEYVRSTIQKKYKYDVSSKMNFSSPSSIHRACQKAKHDFSSVPLVSSSTIHIDAFIDDNHNTHHPLSPFRVKLSREKFNELIYPVINKTLSSLLSQALQGANTTKNNSLVLLSGGSTRILEIQRVIQKFFSSNSNTNAMPILEGTKIHPEENAVTGLALRIAEFEQVKTKYRYVAEPVFGVDHVPLSLGVAIDVICDDEDNNNTDNNNDSESSPSALLLFENIVPRFTSIPLRNRKNVTISMENKKRLCHTINIQILQGERKLAKDNYLLGTFNLSIDDHNSNNSNHANNYSSSSLFEIDQLEITMEVDENGIIHVNASASAAEEGTTKAPSRIKKCGSGVSLSHETSNLYLTSQRLDDMLYETDIELMEMEEQVCANRDAKV